MSAISPELSFTNFCADLQTADMSDPINILRVWGAAERLFQVGGPHYLPALEAIQQQAYRCDEKSLQQKQVTRLAVPISDRGPKISGLNFNYRMIQGTRNQFSSKDQATCTFCAFAAGETLLDCLKNSPDRINSQFVDDSILKGSSTKLLSKVKPGKYAALADAEPQFQKIKNPETSSTALLIDSHGNVGKNEYSNEINKLTDFARINGGLASAVIIKGTISFMIAVDVRDPSKPQFYFYDSHGSNLQGHTNSSLFIFDTQDYLASFMTKAYPAIPNSSVGGELKFNSINLMKFTI